MPSLDNLLKDFPSDQQLYNKHAKCKHLKEKKLAPFLERVPPSLMLKPELSF